MVGGGLQVVECEQVGVDQCDGFDQMVDWVDVVDCIVGVVVYEFCVCVVDCVDLFGDFFFVYVVDVVCNYQYGCVVGLLVKQD